mmetsp:Transcript_41824/g.45406  ORF Transcript_41824/g.45406 Transcript_41824/m.45406 type:complete len:315 (-) Transcript_41824:363-1307(-)
MSNIRGLYDDKNEDDEEEKRRRDANNRFVGGIGAQGGGSGLAVEPNNDENNGNSGPPSLPSTADSIFNIAEQAGAGGSDEEEDASGGESIRRNITMYRNGFVIDDGPYRRLDDPANASFLQSLARGQTPMELLPGADGNIPTGRAAGGGIRNITVGLVDKRKEEYVETFRSFSGAGATLGANDAAGTAGAGAGGGINTNGIFDPSSLPVPNVGHAGGSTTEGDAGDTTSIAVRMLDGKRKIIKIRLDATIEELAALIVQASNTTIAVSFRIVSGFPPKPIIRADGDNADRAGVSKATTIQDSGLKGAQVQLQKA